MSWSTIIETRLDTLLREIDLALIERELGGLGISEGRNIQSASLYNSAYQQIELAATGGYWEPRGSPSVGVRYVHKDTILNPAQTDFNCYTLESFAAAAGLQYPDLWRRRTTVDGDFIYGRMQSGDIIGPWIIEDLQKALGALTRWVRRGRYSIELYGSSVWPYYKAADAESDDIDEGGTLSQAKNRALDGLAARAWDATTSPSSWSRVGRHYNLWWHASMRHGVFHAAVSPDAYPDGTVYRVYLQGDASAPVFPVGTFHNCGNSFLVEGSNHETIRLAKTIVFPSAEIVDLGFSEYMPTYGFPVFLRTPPPFPGGEPDESEVFTHGFDLPMTWDGDNTSGYLRQYNYLVEPALTYG